MRVLNTSTGFRAGAAIAALEGLGKNKSRNQKTRNEKNNKKVFSFHKVKVENTTYYAKRNFFQYLSPHSYLKQLL